jgi:hypothetical protein
MNKEIIVPKCPHSLHISKGGIIIDERPKGFNGNGKASVHNS